MPQARCWLSAARAPHDDAMPRARLNPLPALPDWVYCGTEYHFCMNANQSAFTSRKHPYLTLPQLQLFESSSLHQTIALSLANSNPAAL